MSILLNEGASARAIAAAQLLDIKTFHNELGTGIALITRSNNQRNLVATQILATRDGRFLGGLIFRDDMANDAYDLTDEVVAYFECKRHSFIGPMRQTPHLTSGFASEESDVVTSMVFRAIAASKHTGDDLDIGILEHDAFIEVSRAVVVEWKKGEAEVLKALTPTEAATVMATQPGAIFSWKAFNACACDGKDGEMAREFLARHRTFGPLILNCDFKEEFRTPVGSPLAKASNIFELIRNSASDKEVLRTACEFKRITGGSAAAITRMAGIEVKDLTWNTDALSMFPRLMPLDWLPQNADQANMAGLAVSVGARMGFIGKSEIVDGFEPLEGCGGDWGHFRSDMFRTANEKPEGPHAILRLQNKALAATPLSRDLLRELIVPAAVAFARENTLGVIDALAERGKGDARPVDLVRWLAFKGCNIPAGLKRVTAYLKLSKVREKIRTGNPNATSSHVTVFDNPKMLSTDGNCAIIAIVRPGSATERRYIEGRSELAPKTEIRHIDSRHVNIDGMGRLNTAVLRLSANVPDGSVGVVVGWKNGVRASPMDIVGSIIGGPKEKVGDAVLELSGHLAQFDKSPEKHPDVAAMSAIEANKADVEAMYAAWKPALPRRLRRENALLFSKVIDLEIADYLALPRVAKEFSKPVPPIVRSVESTLTLAET